MAKLSLDLVTNYLNTRNPREKKMVVAAAVMLFMTLDYFLLISPLADAFMKTGPKLAAMKRDLQGLREDKRNQGLIEENWERTKIKIAETEKSFVASNELPALLENLSQLAQDTHVRIVSLKPNESSAKAAKSKPYFSIPIEINASAGTHELGKFLSKLENGPIFFRIVDIKIAANPSDTKRHFIQLNLETYGRAANRVTPS